MTGTVLSERLVLAFLQVVTLCILVMGATFTQAQKPENSKGLEHILQDGVRVVVLNGSHYERGQQHGRVLAREMVELFDGYALRPIRNTEGMAPGNVLSSIQEKLVIPDALRQEARGIVAGAREVLGGDFRSEVLGRVITADDVLAVNAYVDMVGALCSSVSAWGDATKDSTLAGELAVARNLDWPPNPVLLRNQIIFVHQPSEKNEVPFVSVGFPGFLGCLSCFSGRGIATLLNLGYGNDRGSFPPAHRFTPVTLAIRLAIESGDSDGDTLVTPHDIGEVIEQTQRTGSFLVHVVAHTPWQGQTAVVLEISPKAVAYRYDHDDEHAREDVLIATNHPRKHERARSCPRYSKALRQTARRDVQPSLDALWRILDSMRLDSTMQRQLYVPSTGELWLAFRLPGQSNRLRSPFKTSLRQLMTKVRDHSQASTD